MKIVEIDNVLEALQEFINSDKLNEKVLLETPHFSSKHHLMKHYNDHVLGKNEKFNPDNPKFDADMTVEEYAKAAEELADTPADPVQDNGATGAKVTGWVIHQPAKNGKEANRTNRIIKVRLDSKFHPGFFDVVMYVDNKEDNQIFTFMLGKPKNLSNWVDEYQYDLYSQGGPDPLYESVKLIKDKRTGTYYTPDKRFQVEKGYTGWNVNEFGRFDTYHYSYSCDTLKEVKDSLQDEYNN